MRSACSAPHGFRSMIEVGVVQIVFCSRVVDPQDTKNSERNVREILRNARVRNARQGVTGALLTDRASFAQVAEGPIASIESMYSSVINDKRHHGVELLQYAVTHVRLLPSRALAFAEVDRIPHVGGINGHSTSLDRRRAYFSVLAALQPLLLG